MVYLPNYDPGYFWGPPLYYPYANWFYPPFIGGAYWGFGLVINMGFYFGGGWGGWGGWGWHPGWGNHSVFVNNSFIHRNNFNAARGGSLSGNSTWAHDASHRGGVPYSNASVCAPGPAAHLAIEVKSPSVTHTVIAHNVEDWLNGGAKSPREAMEKRRLKGLLDG